MDVLLETERLVLRRLTADDADLMVELDSDPAVMRYLTGGEPTAPEVVRGRDLPSVLAGYERWGGDFGLFAAQRKDSGVFVGWFILRPEPGAPLDEAELGYRCGRHSRNSARHGDDRGLRTGWRAIRDHQEAVAGGAGCKSGPGPFCASLACASCPRNCWR